MKMFLMKTRKPYKSLGLFKPEPDRTYSEFLLWLASYSFDLRKDTVECRTMNMQSTYGYNCNYPAGEPAFHWHQDCHQTSPWLLMWSDYRPTQIQVKGKDEIFTPQPFEVVLVNNLKCVHRAQAITPGDEYNRHFCIVRFKRKKDDR